MDVAADFDWILEAPRAASLSHPNDRAHPNGGGRRERAELGVFLI